MAEAGGSSNIAGVNYEQWVFLYHIVDMLKSKDDNIKLKAQATRALDSNELPIDTFIDDLHKTEGGKRTYFTIKQHATKGVWNASNLNAADIISDVKKQHELSPDQDIVLFTQSDAPCIRQLQRLQGIHEVNEIKLALKNDLSKEWDNLKKFFIYTDEELLELSKFWKIRTSDLHQLQDFVRSNVSFLFDSTKNVESVLFEESFKWAINKVEISKHIVLETLKNRGIIPKPEMNEGTISEIIEQSRVRFQLKVPAFNLENKLNRPEKSEIFKWIESLQKNRNISDGKLLALIGNAGVGKTFLLYDIFNSLNENNIPCIALKADYLKFESLTELAAKLDSSESIERIFHWLNSNHNLSILLIDQIDALSSHLTSDREPMQVYKHLIQKALSFENIAVIISCRTFDLQNELQLRSFAKEKTVKLEVLPQETVRTVIEDLGIESNKVKAETIELLQTPLHLAIFNEVYLRTGEMNFNTLNELYEELYELTLSDSNSRPTTSQIIGNLCFNMYERQELWISKNKFGSQKDQINFLCSSGLLHEYDNRISFFHQSFFDFVLAKSFFEKDYKLSTYLYENSNQNFFERRRVKAIAEYLFEQDKSTFVKEIHEILFGDKKYRTHIKYLLLNVLGQKEELTQEITELGRKILHDSHLKIPFLKSIISVQWIKFLTEQILLELNSEFECRAFLYQFRISDLNKASALVSLLYKYHSHLEEEQVAWALSRLVLTSSNQYMELYQKYRETIWKNDHPKYVILYRAADNGDGSFVFNEFKNYFETLKQYQIENKSEYLGSEYIKIIQKAHSLDPEKGFEIIKELFNDICTNSMSSYQPYTDLKHCNAFLNFKHNETTDKEDHGQLFYLLRNNIIRLSLENTERAKKEIIELLNSEFEIAFCCALSVIVDAPEIFSEIALNALTLKAIPVYYHWCPLRQYLTRECITAIFPFLNKNEQRLIYDKCKSLRLPISEEPIESRKRRLTDQRKTHYELISSIPEESRDTIYGLRIELKELERKFGPINNQKPKGIEVAMSSGERSLPKKVYEKLSLGRLESTMVGIGANSDFSKEGPNAYGHSKEFQALCENNPGKYFPLVEKIISEFPENNILMIYLIRGLVGLSSKCDPESLLKLVQKYFLKRNRFDYAYEEYNIIEKFVELPSAKTQIVEFLESEIKRITFSSEGYHGYILSTLARVSKNPDYKQLCLSCLKTIEDGNNEQLKLMLCKESPYFFELDKDKVWDSFTSIAHAVENPEKFKYLRGGLQCMLIYKTDSLTEIIREAITRLNEDTHKNWFGQLIGWYWLHEYPLADQIILEAENETIQFKAGILSLLIDAIQNEELNSDLKVRSWIKVNEYLAHSDDSIYNAYQILIRGINENSFKEYLPFLKSYINSKARKVKNRFRDLNGKLFELASIHREDCIMLSELDSQSDQFSKQFAIPSNDKTTIDILIRAYNSLSESLHKEQREKALDLIDNAMEFVANYSEAYFEDITNKLDASDDYES